jgi:hypothetical protein
MPYAARCAAKTSILQWWTMTVHTKKDAGRLGNRILREAGVE